MSKCHVNRRLPESGFTGGSNRQAAPHDGGRRREGARVPGPGLDRLPRPAGGESEDPRTGAARCRRDRLSPRQRGPAPRPWPQPDPRCDAHGSQRLPRRPRHGHPPRGRAARLRRPARRDRSGPRRVPGDRVPDRPPLRGGDPARPGLADGGPGRAGAAHGRRLGRPPRTGRPGRQCPHLRGQRRPPGHGPPGGTRPPPHRAHRRRAAAPTGPRCAATGSNPGRG